MNLLLKGKTTMMTLPKIPNRPIYTDTSNHRCLGRVIGYKKFGAKKAGGSLFWWFQGRGVVILLGSNIFIKWCRGKGK